LESICVGGILTSRKEEKKNELEEYNKITNNVILIIKIKNSKLKQQFLIRELSNDIYSSFNY
jgi:hypothetical protein